MLRIFEDYNKSEINLSNEKTIFSMDIKSFYPSIDPKQAASGLKNKLLANPLYKHQTKYHPQEGCKFKLKVTGRFSDALTRQADEGVRIQKLSEKCMNSKSEFHQPAIKRISITSLTK